MAILPAKKNFPPVALWIIVMFGGCYRGTPMPTTKPSASEPTRSEIELPLGKQDLSQWGYFPFQIKRIDKAQRPITNPPGHEAGGDWTFMECQTTGAESHTKFTVGIEIQAPAKTLGDFGYGKAVLHYGR